LFVGANPMAIGAADVTLFHFALHSIQVEPLADEDGH